MPASLPVFQPTLVFACMLSKQAVWLYYKRTHPLSKMASEHRISSSQIEDGVVVELFACFHIHAPLCKFIELNCCSATICSCSLCWTLQIAHAAHVYTPQIHAPHSVRRWISSRDVTDLPGNWSSMGCFTFVNSVFSSWCRLS